MRGWVYIAFVTLMLGVTTGPAAACTLPVIQYFAKGSSALDERSESALATVFSWLQRNANGLRQIRVVGHSDRTGSRRARRAISLARAEAVRDRLVSYGVPASLIMVQASGDASPAIDTPDGVSDPDNRRTEILVEMTESWRVERQSSPPPAIGSITTC